MTLFVGETYDEPGATANDDRDGNLTSDIVIDSSVDTETVGTYHVTYDVNDSAGNSAVQMVRTVDVVLPPDTTPPIITSSDLIDVYENDIEVMTITATDDNPILYTISGTDADSFTINETTGYVAFKIAPDFESNKTSYFFTAIATDTNSNESQMGITVYILDIEGISGCWKQISTPVLDINQSKGAENASMIYDKNMDMQVVSWTEGTWDNANYYVKNYDGDTWSILGNQLNDTTLSAWPRVVIKSEPYAELESLYAYFRDENMTLKHWDGEGWHAIYSTDEYTFGEYDMLVDDDGHPLISGIKGDYDLHFKKYDGSSWIDLPWLRSGDSRSFDYPDLVMKEDGNPLLLTQYTDGYSYMRIFDYNGTEWIDLGYIESNIATRQAVCASMILSSSGNPIVAYVEQDLPNQGSGDKKVYVKEYKEGSWHIIGDALNGSKIVNTAGNLESGGGYNQCISLAENHDDDLYIAWQHEENGRKGIFIQKYNSQDLVWDAPENFLTDEEKLRAPSLTIDNNGHVNISALYDSTPNRTDDDDIKVYRCEEAPPVQYHINIEVLDYYGSDMDLNVTSHINKDFMAIHTSGTHTFNTTFSDNEKYEIEVETSSEAKHEECFFIDEQGSSLGMYIYGEVNASDVNLAIDCSG